MLCAPLHRLRTERARNPHRRMRFLIRQRPRIHVAIMEMLALVAPRAGPRPGLHDKVMRLVEHLAVVGGIRVVEELLAARAAHPSGHQPAARNQIDLGQLFGHPQRMFDHRQRIADQHEPHALGAIGEHGGLDVHHRPHANRVAVMFVQRDDVEAEILGIAVFVEIVMIIVGGSFAIVEPIGDGEKRAVLENLFLGQPSIRPLREITYLHLPNTFYVVRNRSSSPCFILFHFRRVVRLLSRGLDFHTSRGLRRG